MLRSRSGTSSDSASRTTMARPGTDRPLSMKLTCRCVVPARSASSSWLTRRRVRHSRKAPASPPGSGWVITQPCLPEPSATGYSLQGIAEPQHRTQHRKRHEHVTTDGEVMTDIDPQELVRRYVAVWNEPDAGLRRKAIHDLWTEDGAHILQPPQEIRKAATALGFTSTTLHARG